MSNPEVPNIFIDELNKGNIAIRPAADAKKPFVVDVSHLPADVRAAAFEGYENITGSKLHSSVQKFPITQGTFDAIIKDGKTFFKDDFDKTVQGRLEQYENTIQALREGKAIVTPVKGMKGQYSVDFTPTPDAERRELFEGVLDLAGFRNIGERDKRLVVQSKAMFTQKEYDAIIEQGERFYPQSDAPPQFGFTRELEIRAQHAAENAKSRA
jgi:hypothetical protein